jgi:hypothetical protein
MSAAKSEVLPKTDNEWTVMVFFAGDPLLSPSMTAQLKALKDAGFQDQTTVLVHYDPNEKRVATTFFEINRARKKWLKDNHQKATRIGDGNDPFVRNLIEDRLEDAIAKTTNASEALDNFLKHGIKTKAKHYLVFLVGHGVIVGNDFFLPDHHPEETGIKLTKLGEILRNFQKDAKDNGGEVELIGLHSCSMSAIEVAYELKGAAKYMLATEGSSFVTSWPYRQLIKKILNTVEREGKDVEVDDLVKSIQQLSLHNSKDFMFSGLSADVCLCSLEPSRIEDLTGPIQDLTTALKAGLDDERGRELITMAHLKAQSYFQENYTDLYDFCRCLEEKCNNVDETQKAMKAACGELKEKLKESDGNVIVQADFFGPVLQYSHGLSIFFPWSEPMDEPKVPGDTMLGRYNEYVFTQAFKDPKDESKDHSWLSFLKDYFLKTRRASRQDEEPNWPKPARNGANRTPTLRTVLEGGSTASNGANGADVLAAPDKPISGLDKPISGLDKPISGLEGAGCGCSVKNYPMEFLIRSPRANGPYSKDKLPAAQPQEQPTPTHR